MAKNIYNLLVQEIFWVQLKYSHASRPHPMHYELSIRVILKLGILTCIQMVVYVAILFHFCKTNYALTKGQDRSTSSIHKSKDLCDF